LEQKMLELRRSEDRGHANHGWLDARHSFSFADYYDPQHMGFGPLRVLNDDRIAAGGGFGTHPHRDMEIITYVLDGELAHKDSMGNGSVIRPGDVQRMSAGTGVMHSEYNHARDQTTHLLQIWIEPKSRGIPPGYEEKRFAADEKRGRLRLIASTDGEDGSVKVHQDIKLYAGLIDGNEQASLDIPAGHKVYLHVASGQVNVNGVDLQAGDAIKAVNEDAIHLTKGSAAEVLLFDLT
jgi:redox-sensitive bicupin YhaK (pirin superfamily)